MKYDISKMDYRKGCEAVKASIPTAQIVDEIAYALRVIESHVGLANTVVEVGSAYGGSLAMLSMIATDDAKMISIDPRPLGHGITKFVRPTIRITKFDGLSDDANIRAGLGIILDGSGIDVLHIDSVKDSPYPRKTFTSYSKLVNCPGIIMFHDIGIGGVRDIWDEVSIDYPHEVICTRMNRLKSWYGIGMIFM